MGVANYLGAIWLEKVKVRKTWALVSLLVLNLAVLFFFKYFVWAITTVLGVLEWFDPDTFSSLWNRPIAIPLGISFFTFHAISYLLDVYRRQIKASRSVWKFMTYFCMFPHLVAGPIVRYAQVQEDIEKRGAGKTEKELFSFGMYRFLLGLNKKVLIANSAAVLADTAFALSQQGNLTFCDAWIGIVAYTIQIYFDFCGYSDMAIGLAAMAGFHFEENFLRPYSSTSLRDFWRRWHISLSCWLRDYLYIPLGGSRCSTLMTYRNLLIIFLACGVWHGANFTFVVWGLWHGLFLVGERVWHKWAPDWSAPHVVCRLYAILVVMIGWVFFRAESLGEAGVYIATLFSFGGGAPALAEFLLPLLVLPVAVIICAIPDRLFPSPTSRTPGNFPFALYVVQALLAVESVALLAQGGRNPFIYFNF